MVITYTPTYFGPGDVVSGATAWWGLRAYNEAFAASGGNAITVRRASDNTTQTIVVLSTGALDVSTASTFCASTTCYVTEAFDQTGHSNNVIQATTSAQPQLVFNCIGSLPCLGFTNTSDQGLTATYTLAQPLTVTAVALTSVAGSSTYQPIVGSSTSGDAYLEFAPINSSSNGIALAAKTGGGIGYSAITQSTFYAMVGVLNGASSVLDYDGTTTSGSAGTNGIGTQVSWGTDSTADWLEGQSTEAGVWGSAFTTGQQSSMVSNQRTYWGI